MSRPRTTPTDRIMNAIGTYACLRAEAQWTNGYRARFEAQSGHDTAEAHRLYSKEVAQWEAVYKQEKKLRATVARILYEVTR